MTATIEQRFNALDWHDAILLQLNVDRNTPGENDEVLLVVEWPDGTRRNVRFSDCYVLEAQMNFGVIAPETIRDAQCCTSSTLLDEVRQRWKGLGVTLDELRHFETRTSSTASAIRICAPQFQVISPIPHTRNSP